jgi:hypothetical protein
MRAGEQSGGVVASSDDSAANIDGAMAFIEKAQQALAQKSHIRGCRTRVKKEADGAGGHLDGLVTEVDDLLQEARRLLSQ